MVRRSRTWLRAGWILVLTVAAGPVAARSGAGNAVTEANYRLAARFAPYKMRRLVYSLTVNPRWIEGTERFWYEWETSAGKFYYLVDPVAGTKRQLFDNDRLAAELTRITKDPWDGQHLPVRRIRFVDANTLQFEVESSQDEGGKDAEAERGQQQQDQQQGQGQERRGTPRAKKKVFHFTYDVRTETLREITDWQAPGNHPSWASVYARRPDHRLRPQAQPVHDDGGVVQEDPRRPTWGCYGISHRACCPERY